MEQLSFFGRNKDELLEELEDLLEDVIVQAQLLHQTVRILIFLFEEIDVLDVKQAALDAVQTLLVVAGPNSTLTVKGQTFTLGTVSVTELAKHILGDDGLAGFFENGYIEVEYTAVVDYFNNPNIQLSGTFIFEIILKIEL